MTFGDLFAENSFRGALLRAAIAWAIITPAVAIAKILWSGTAALVVGVVGVAAYVSFVVGYIRRHRPPSE
jgi:hypothetical protein